MASIQKLIHIITSVEQRSGQLMLYRSFLSRRAMTLPRFCLYWASVSMGCSAGCGIGPPTLLGPKREYSSRYSKLNKTQLNSHLCYCLYCLKKKKIKRCRSFIEIWMPSLNWIASSCISKSNAIFITFLSHIFILHNVACSYHMLHVNSSTATVRILFAKPADF